MPKVTTDGDDLKSAITSGVFMPCTLSEEGGTGMWTRFSQHVP